MLDALLGNKTAERALLYIANYGEGHTSGIASTFDLPKSQVYKQLLRLEAGRILVAREVGNCRMFTFNPRLPYKSELQLLLEKAITLLPELEVKQYFSQRRRPRRIGKKIAIGLNAKD